MSMSISSTSSCLLRRVRSPDDTAAWERFVELYAPLIYRWLRQAGLQEQDARDLGQEVLLTLLRELPTFRYDSQKGRFRSWLRRVVQLRLLVHWRQRNRRQRWLEDWYRDRPAYETDVGHVGAYDELLEWLRWQCKDLPTRTRRAFWLTVVEHQDPQQVARHLGMTRNAVYLARCRVFRQLRAACADESASLTEDRP